MERIVPRVLEPVVLVPRVIHLVIDATACRTPQPPLGAEEIAIENTRVIDSASNKTTPTGPGRYVAGNKVVCTA